jgi:putative ABC transport system permease protein
MYRNYLKVALRNIFRQGAYSMINIIGLTIGIASFLLIVLYVQYELSFDSSANDPETIYRVVEVQNHQGVGEQHVSFTPAPMKKTMVDNFPEVLDGF